MDEVDRMLDMGFGPVIQTIVNNLPQKRQTLLFSVTMLQDIRRFSKQLLK
ncbi:MAG: DEAD/DEAH box helicase [Saprospiraceae bacterium]|nr:DEAD/DEAH box helicase [Saprospiraceae bacterium]